jgi:hypothetical protein
MVDRLTGKDYTVGEGADNRRTDCMKRSRCTRKRSFAKIGVVVTGLLLLLTPHILYGQSSRDRLQPPPVGVQIVREGDFAAGLEAAFKMGTGRNEIEAENRLAELGIMPRNGWMADYPVTPDVLGELQEAVGIAADSGKLSISRDDALKRIGEVASSAGLFERPFTSSGTYGEPGAAESYRDPEAVSGYYADQGPPVVTYYAPPPYYDSLYSFVPYPFWYSTFWFPGFFVLRDFHGHRGHGFVSNHFTQATTNRVVRVDAVSRVNGGSVTTFRAGGISGAGTRSGASVSVAASVPRTISSNVPRATVQRGGLARASGPVAGVPGHAIRSFGAPRTTMFSSPRMTTAGGGVRAAPFFGGYNGSRIGGSSFSNTGGSRGGGARSGGAHRR